MSSIEYNDRVFTPFLQAKLCSAIDNGATKAVELFNENGLELWGHDDPEFKKLPFHMCIPQYFPASRDVVDNGYDWSRVPKELPVGIMVKAMDYTSFMQVIRSGDKPIETAQRNCSHILTRLHHFMKEYPEISENNVRVNLHLAGYGFNGLLAAAMTVCLKDWADSTGSRLVCTTFESPGLTPFYQDVAVLQTRRDEWKEVITNYVSIPNPINMAYRHLGRIVYLDIESDAANVVRVARFALQAAPYFFTACSVWSMIVAPLCERWSTNGKTDFTTVLGVGSKVLDSRYGGMVFLVAFATAYVKQGARNHSLSNMVEAFEKAEPGSDGPCVAWEMESWPTYTSVETFMSHNWWHILEASMPHGEDNTEPLDRQKMSMERLREMDGFVVAGKVER